MKAILLLLIVFVSNTYSQKQVFNVQKYCIDDLPFKTNQCDISGNEYSFVFLDMKKSEVVFFLTELKYKYQIISSNKNAGGFTTYKLTNGSEEVEMKVNAPQTKIEFLYPNRHISLTVGKSTKQNSK